ncbi:MAG: hypothetical protein ACRC62_26330 [Microcoleus sp.]
MLHSVLPLYETSPDVEENFVKIKKKEEGRRKKEEGRRKREEGRGKKEEF